MEDRKQIMSWLEGLAQDDWPMYHSDSEVQEIAKEALALLKEQEEQEEREYREEHPCESCQEYLCDGCPYDDK